MVTVTDLVEKPVPGSAPSNWILIGRYVCDAAVFDVLRRTPPGRGGEIQLTDALLTLAKQRGLIAATLVGTRHDAGDRLGYLRANLAYALKRPELADGVRAICREILDG